MYALAFHDRDVEHRGATAAIGGGVGKGPAVGAENDPAYALRVAIFSAATEGNTREMRKTCADG